MQMDSTPLYPKAILNTQWSEVESILEFHKNTIKTELWAYFSDPHNVQKPSGPLLLGPQRSETTCPFCLSGVKTTVKYITTSRTHITAALFSLICCCCCIPYCCNSAKNTVHYCPSCNKYLGTYEK